MMKKLTQGFLLLLLLIGCTPAVQTPAPATAQPSPFPATESAPRAESAHWWNDAVFYEIFVRSYQDSDGDGIGDFNGLAQRLDYLQQLGVNAIWLMPIFPSPSYHGYDVLNYYGVNPEYGDMEDFKNFLNEAHERDIRVIVDFVVNHTSSQHPFFVNANSGPAAEFRDWYVWSDTPGDRWHEGNDGYYYGYFGSGMPDLNYRNPDVTDQMYAVTSYWLEDVGVDGFRIDAAKHLIEEGKHLENTEATHEWYRDFYTFYKSEEPEAYVIGEVFGAGGFIASTYTEQMDQIFNFELASGFLNSVAGESNTGVNSAWNFTLEDIQNGEYGTFLANHDQNRVMSVLNGNVEKAKLAAVMLLTSPGTPFIYYGEEIGMQGKKPDEDIRLPMQWSAEVNAGFTSGNPWRAPDSNYTEVNVAQQETDRDSLLSFYQMLTGLRGEQVVLRTGALTLLETENPGVYAMLRSKDDEAILVLINLKGTPVSDYELSLEDSLLPDGELRPEALLSTPQAAPLTISGGKFSGYKPVAELEAYQAYIFQIQ